MIAARAKRDAAIAERDQTLSQMDRLQHLLRQLQRAQCGLHSEKLHPEQLQLVIEDFEQAIGSEEAAHDGKDTASHPACYAAPRQPLVRFRPPCISSVRRPHGASKSCWQSSVIVTHPKYASRACADGVVQSPSPERLIKCGLSPEAIVAHVLVAKYAWHLPAYRRAQMLLA